MAYNEAQRAMAVEIVRRYGGLTGQAIADIRAALEAPGLSKSTLHGWLPRIDRTERIRTEPNESKKRTRVPSVLALDQAADTLDMMFEDIARKYLDRAGEAEAIGNTKGKDAVMAAAIAVDKMRLLRDLPTEIVQVLPPLLDAFTRNGIKASDVFAAMLQELSNADTSNAGG